MNKVDIARRYMLEGNFSAALPKLVSWAERCPKDVDVLVDISACALQLGYPVLAKEYIARILSLDSTNALALNNLGLAYQMENYPLEALVYYTAAASHGYKDADFNASLCYLKAGMLGNNTLMLKDAFQMYESRFTKSTPVTMPNLRGLPRWDGVSPGKVLVIAEQGVGDVVLFSRYLQFLDNFEFILDPNIKCLFSATPEIHSRIILDMRDSQADFYIPLMSLPGVLDKYVVDFPYSFHKATGDSLGVCYTGNPQHKNNAHRQCTQLRKIRAEVNLQYGDNPDIVTWEDTIQHISKCSHVITVDTSIAHIAAMMGCQVYMVQPKFNIDWRWGNGTGVSPWYPNLQMFTNPDDAHRESIRHKC